jgi:hypothetical protein
MRLIFVNDVCVKRVGGEAGNDILGGVMFDEPFECVGVRLNRIVLVGGVPTVNPMTQAEIDAQEHAALSGAFVRALLTDRFELENRVRVLEGKAQITEAQFKTALKTKLGL